MDYRFLIVLCSFLSVQSASYNIDFWFQQKKGANVFNEVVVRSLIRQAKLFGIEFIRLAPDEFLTKGRNFLVGNAVNPTAMPPTRLQHLRSILDLCAEEGMPVVLTMLSLPRSHCKQHLRPWYDKRYVGQAVSFWTDCARELRGHPALVAYDILNEPYAKNYSGLVLHDVHAHIIAGIRSVNKDIPIVIESFVHADPVMFGGYVLVNNDKVIYSFHVYELLAYANQRVHKERFRYPGYIDDISLHSMVYCDKDYLGNYKAPVRLLQTRLPIL